jgi:PleD family two-component response regulator
LDRICCLIREKDFTFGERSIKVTISGGLSTIVPSGSLSLEEGIALADGALYRAKERGRDSVCLHIDSENE